ncbi:MAG: ATP-binding protein [Butyrivibrio sp.]
MKNIKLRKIIKINEEKCNGCGACATACHEGAIEMIDGKAKLVHENYCDGLGDCLPACPTNAISFEEREAMAYDATAAAGPFQWPIQIKLVPVNSPNFDNANLLIAADCIAYAYGNFYNEFIRNHITLIGCPKLDECNYADKLTEIIINNNIKSVTVARMEVPCCKGIENAVKQALQSSGKFIPWRVVTISTDGRITD